MKRYAIRKFACTKAFTATAAKIRKIRVATMMPITLRRFIQVCPLQPTVWNMLQKPCTIWSQIATNHTM